MAANLVDIIDYFKNAISYAEVDVEISTEARTYMKHTSVQNALWSLIGIYMVSSGCPILDKLRPLVGSHLPFATLQETTYRAISMYLLAQYFLQKRGQEADWELKKLTEIYENIQTVNKCFHGRISDVHVGDAGLNAIIHLDAYAQFTNMLLLRAVLDDIEKMFRAYLDIEPAASNPSD